MKIKDIDVASYKVRRNKENIWNFENDKALILMYNRLMLVATNVFEWEGLPISVDPVYLEKNLAKLGSLCFFEDKNMDYNQTGKDKFVLPYMPSYRRDIYGEPIVRRVFTAYNNGYRKDNTIYNSVIIYDNTEKLILDEFIYEFAKHLTKINIVKDANLEQQKTPYIIGAVKEIQQELEQFMKQKANNKPYFIVDESKVTMLKEALQVYSTNAELLVNELQDYYDAIWNEFMTMVGVGNNVSPKRERLVAGEVDSVNEQAQAFANARLNARKRACNIINEMYNLNVTVRYRFDKENSEEDSENGTVHDRASGSDEKPSPSEKK